MLYGHIPSYTTIYDTYVSAPTVNGQKSQIITTTYNWDGTIYNKRTQDITKTNSGVSQVDNDETNPNQNAALDYMSNPEFQTLFQSFQFDPWWLQKCLDAGYVSNFPQYASHFASAMKSLRKIGLVQ